MHVLWRGPDEVQIGVDNPRILSGLSPQEVELLMKWPRLSPLGVKAELQRLGVSAERWRELTRPAPVAPRKWASGARAAVLDEHPISRAAAAMLHEAGLPTFRRLTRHSVALLTDSWLTDPARMRPLMEAGVPFVPVVVGELGIEVGPAVLPGATACPRCRHAARTARDPRWATVAPQLLAAHAAPEPPPHRLALAAAVAAHLVMALAAGRVPPGWRIDHLGPRPLDDDVVDCGCGGALTPPSEACRALA
jgi:hypothetical protein